MFTLQEHNDALRDAFDINNQIKEAKGAGVKCRDCNVEMYHSDDVIRAVNPPKRKVHCPKCKQFGFKII